MSLASLASASVASAMSSFGGCSHPAEVVMAIEVGKRCYAKIHAYRHYVFEVAAVLGQRHVEAVNVVRVQSSPRRWTEFFRDGFGPGDVYEHFPNGELSGWFAIFEWDHEIPRRSA
jgi:hypothetical protein